MPTKANLKPKPNRPKSTPTWLWEAESEISARVLSPLRTVARSYAVSWEFSLFRARDWKAWIAACAEESHRTATPDSARKDWGKKHAGTQL